MDNNSEVRLSFVHPVLAAKIRQLADMLEGEGIPIAAIQGLRTWPTQDALWQKGRNEDGSYIDPVHHKGVVTNARGGYSWHNFGCAVDCAVEFPDHQTIDWNAEHPAWKRMEAVGVSLGLTSGANWHHLPDAPHFQLTGRFPEAAPDDEVRELFKSDAGIQAVWDAVTASLPEGQVSPNVAQG